MSHGQMALLWWKQLLSELGSSASKHSGDERDKAFADRRHKSLTSLFFDLCLRAETDVLFEIGAHFAETSAEFVIKIPNARAFAFEANPKVFQKAQEKGLPSEVRYSNLAMSRESGTISFFAPNDEHYEIWGSLKRRAGYENVTQIVVDSITLDQAVNDRLADYNRRGLALWIDVEGSAFDILCSGLTALQSKVSVVYTEINDVAAYEKSDSSLAIFELMLSHGFVPIARDNEWIDAWNILFIHQSVLKSLQETIAKWTYSEMSAMERVG